MKGHKVTDSDIKKLIDMATKLKLEGEWQIQKLSKELDETKEQIEDLKSGKNSATDRDPVNGT